MADTITVILADDHPLVRSGIRATINTTQDIRVVAETGTTEGLAQLCQEFRPAVLVLDVNMPGPDLKYTLTMLQRDYPQAKIVVLSASADAAVAGAALAKGVAGYVLKDETVELLNTAIRTVAHGATWYSRRVMEVMVQTPVQRAPLGELTEREVEIFYGIIQGHSNHTIARRLQLGEQTVRNYTSRIYEKLGVQSRAATVVWAHKQGIVPPASRDE